MNFLCLGPLSSQERALGRSGLEAENKLGQKIRISWEYDNRACEQDLVLQLVSLLLLRAEGFVITQNMLQYWDPMQYSCV